MSKTRFPNEQGGFGVCGVYVFIQLNKVLVYSLGTGKRRDHLTLFQRGSALSFPGELVTTAANFSELTRGMIFVKPKDL